MTLLLATGRAYRILKRSKRGCEKTLDQEGGLNLSRRQEDTPRIKGIYVESGRVSSSELGKGRGPGSFAWRVGDREGDFLKMLAQEATLTRREGIFSQVWLQGSPRGRQALT